MRPSILIVDDDPNIRETAVDILEDAGFQIHTAGTAAEAIAELSKTTFQLVITDLHLPDLSGEQLARKIREAHPAMKILVMSGEQDVQKESILEVANAILLKPVAPPELVALIKKTLDQ